MELANAAAEHARRASPAVRALIAARYAHAQAATGMRPFRQATEEAYALLAKPRVLDTRPDWLYWFDGLDVITGQSLITAAYATTRDPTPLLEEAETLLVPWLSSGTDREDLARDAVYHGVWLTRTYIRRRELDPVLSTGSAILNNAPSVRSRSTNALLRQLDDELGAWRAVRDRPDVTRFRGELRDVVAA